MSERIQLPPSDHYREAERLLAAIESPGTGLEVQTVAASAALVHAILATVPAKALRGRHQRPKRYVATPIDSSGGSPSQRWLRGDDQPGR